MPVILSESGFTIEMINRVKKDRKVWIPYKSHSQALRKKPWDFPVSPRIGKVHRGYTYLGGDNGWRRGHFENQPEWIFRIGGRYSRKLFTDNGIVGLNNNRWMGKIKVTRKEEHDYDD